MWSGPLHDPIFVGKVLAHVDGNKDSYGTAGRMRGMLTLAKEVQPKLTSAVLTLTLSQQELQVPFYFTPSKVSSFFHCETPSLDDVA